MVVGRVVGNLVATVQCPVFKSRKLLVVQPLDLDGAPSGAEVIAVDAADAGAGDVVLVLSEGNSARQVTGVGEEPVDCVVVGVVDRVSVPGRPGLPGGGKSAAPGGTKAR